MLSIISLTINCLILQSLAVYVDDTMHCHCQEGLLLFTVQATDKRQQRRSVAHSKLTK